MKLFVLALFALSVTAQAVQGPPVPLPDGAPADCVPDTAISNPFPAMPGQETCCCPDHPGPPRCYPDTPCTPNVPRVFCQGTPEYPWKVCVTDAPTPFPTTRNPTPQPTTRGPTPVPPTPFPTTRQPTTRNPTPQPTTRGPTPVPPTPRPTTRNPTPVPPTPRPTTQRPTRFPTPEPTPGPVCDCIFDPKLPAIPGFPIDACEGISGHRCVCEGCDFTFNRAPCVEWVQFDITQDTYWSKENTYIVKGEIHVCLGAELIIEPGTVVIFEDWPVSTLLDAPRAPHTTSVWSVLVVNSDSSIVAENVSFEGKSHEAQQLAAGLVILGNGASIAHPQYPSIASVAGATGRRSTLNKVRLVNLGHAGTQLGALNLIGTRNSDVYLSHIFVGNSGSDGIRTWGNTATFNGVTSTRALAAALRAEAGSVFDIAGHGQLQGKNAFVLDASSTVTVKAGTYWNVIDRLVSTQLVWGADHIINNA